MCPPVQSAPTDDSAMLASANAFYTLGKYFLTRPRPEVPEGSFRNVPEGFGEVVGAATNLSFSLELYLKALLARLEIDYERTHNLARLYGALPGDERAHIEAVYDRLLSQVPPGSRGALTLAKGPAVPPDWGRYSRDPHDLASVLRRSGDAFGSWRYIFEFRPDQATGYQLHQFEYVCLDLACQAIRSRMGDR
jgi:hypothetical protein